MKAVAKFAETKLFPSPGSGDVSKITFESSFTNKNCKLVRIVFIDSLNADLGLLLTNNSLFFIFYIPFLFQLILLYLQQVSSIFLLFLHLILYLYQNKILKTK